MKVATWNFSGLYSEHKQEVGELLVENNRDIVAGQEFWEKEDSKIEANGYKWFKKPLVFKIVSQVKKGLVF